MAYSGAWVRQSTTRPNVPLQAPTDPEHLNPTEGEDHPGQLALWQNQAPAPVLPTVMEGGQYEQPSVPAGPLDMTPADPSFGAGVGPGLTTLEAQEVRGALMGLDLGAYAAHRYMAGVDRDGAPHVQVIDDVDYQGDSPQTLEYQRSGLGTPNDPFARRGRRIKRWYDRFIDMHRYDVELRPKYSRYAATVATQNPVQNGTQLTSPFPAFVDRAGTADSFVTPQDRRTPAPWDQAATTDGTGQGSMFGLGSWGL